MAEIIPFRALHYNAQRGGSLSNLVTQPYDKISPEMQARYYALSPNNLVRIIRPNDRLEATPGEDPYARANRHFRGWIEQAILISGRQPALFPYSQEYSVPGQPGGKKTRKGFIALLHLEDYDRRVVHRHEETLSGPKADRLSLLRATHAHFGQIFLLYSDPDGGIESSLDTATSGKPWEQVEDEYGTLHSVWQMNAEEAIGRVVEGMREKKLVIADGHHRYETALAFRDECRAQNILSGRAEYVMATFVRMEQPGLTILPTHRVIHGLPHFSWDKLSGAAREAFEWVETSLPGNTAGDAAWIAQKIIPDDHPTFGAYAGPDKFAVLRLRKDFDLAKALPDVPPQLRELDVVVLHRWLLEKMLGIDRQAVREEKNLHYVREIEAALDAVNRNKAQLCFLLNPTPVVAVRDAALAGLAMPQKSTDFYPKLLSGLTNYWLDNPAGM
ncbi:MAG TPA: DUF1015 domain-containing protein [Terriglobia bacterium]|nr:DUF1015 domain-containing protein [Terriglobia bacterium]